MIQIVFDASANHGGIRLRFVDRWQRDRLLRLQETTERREGGRRVREAKDRDSVSIPDRHRIFPGFAAVLVNDETVYQFDGRIFWHEPHLNGPVILLDRP